MNDLQILATLQRPISEIVNPRAYTTKSALARLGIKTIQELIEFLPFRYEDQTNVVEIKSLKPEVESVIIGRITSVTSRRSKKGVLLVQANIKDESGSITALWFNQRYLLKTLREQDEITLYGIKKIIPSMKNPFLVKKIIDRPEICPIYHRSAGISQLTIRKLILSAIKEIDQIPNFLPEPIRQKLSLPRREQALRNVHQPSKIEDLDQARKLLAAEELLFLAIRAENARNARINQKRDPIKISSDFLQKFVAQLPFKLTESQRKAAWEIMTDLQKSYPMNRLLYGEVGSGKTAVAAVVAAAVSNSGKRTAVLCPTLALAEQLYRVLSEMFKHTDFSVGISSSIEKKNQSATIIVGTHALLRQTTAFDLIVIDEQHRFGVEQRRTLLQNNPLADVLMMSATPIPRSFAQTLLRHLDITYLTQKPSHQKEIISRVFTPTERKSVEKTIESLLEFGEQGYVVCPRIIEQNEEVLDLFTEEKKSVQSELKRLKAVFPNARIAAIHGQKDSAENKKVLEKFRNQQIDILVATTIIEVGIDNPNATWILIEDADHFGLSTLHQLRGRVGRGEKQSYCFVANTDRSAISNKRLQAFSEITSGLELSETDLEIRGPGELTGLDQSGAIALRYASWSDSELLQQVFAEARKIVEDGLTKYPMLQNVTNEEDQLAAA